MRTSYFGYCFECMQDGQKFLADAEPLAQYVNQASLPTVASQVVYAGENLYLLRVSARFYAFVQTKNHEIIKRITNSTGRVKAEEMASLLGNDTIAFASYLYLDPNRRILALASRMGSPRVTSLQHFFNEVLLSLGLGGYRFAVEAMMEETTHQKAMSMQIVGRTRLMLQPDNSFFRLIMDTVSARASDREMVGSIEVILKPAPRKNIRNTALAALTSVGTEGASVVMRAKQDADDKLRDLFIMTSGGIHDEIHSTADGEVLTEMQQRMQENAVLIEKAQCYEQDPTFLRTLPQDLGRILSPGIGLAD